MNKKKILNILSELQLEHDRASKNSKDEMMAIFKSRNEGIAYGLAIAMNTIRSAMETNDREKSYMVELVRLNVPQIKKMQDGLKDGECVVVFITGYAIEKRVESIGTTFPGRPHLQIRKQTDLSNDSIGKMVNVAWEIREDIED